MGHGRCESAARPAALEPRHWGWGEGGGTRLVLLTAAIIAVAITARLIPSIGTGSAHPVTGSYPWTVALAQLPATAVPGRAAGRLVPAPHSSSAAHSLQSHGVTMARKWGLGGVPLRPPKASRPLKQVFGGKNFGVLARVPTRDNVVFLTIDDGAEKDPLFAEMVRDLSIPFTSFLTDYASRDNYGYFKHIQELGHHPIENHTATHPDMPKLSFQKQRDEICQQQDNLEEATGVRPRLFRPPYGNYNETTLSAARTCGLKGVVLWSAEAFPDRIDYPTPERKLGPGDIILTHFRGPGQWRGTMVDMLRRVLRAAADQGLAVAALEDYV